MKDAGTTGNEISGNSRLAAIGVKLLGMIVVKGLPQIQQIALLSRAGFSPKEIGELLGTTANTVRVALVGIRKAERASKGLFKLNRKDKEDEEAEL